jgi:hypothetical protein
MTKQLPRLNVDLTRWRQEGSEAVIEGNLR